MFYQTQKKIDIHIKGEFMGTVWQDVGLRSNARSEADEQLKDFRSFNPDREYRLVQIVEEG